MRVVQFRLSRQVKVVLLLWCLGELAAFAVVAHVIGVGGATLVGLATSLIGFSLLKQAGASAMLKLRAAFEGRRAAGQPGDVVDDTLAAVGAFALIMPGFLSDIAGVALLVPPARAQVVRWVGRRTRPGRPPGAGPSGASGTIDLDPDEWRHTSPANPPIPKV